MPSVLKSYEANPALLPAFDVRMNGYVSVADSRTIALPVTVRNLPAGTHEIVGGREIHVAIALIGTARLYRVYNFNIYEKRFKEVIDVLMAGTGVFALLTIWLSFGLSGLLVWQVATLRLGESAPIHPGKYDETEFVALVDAFNAYPSTALNLIVLPTLALRYGRFERDTLAEPQAASSNG